MNPILFCCLFMLFPMIASAELINENQETIHLPALRQQLKETEHAAQRIEYKLKKTQQALAAEKLKLQHLTQEQSELTTKLQQEKLQLSKQVTLAYRINDTSLLHALLLRQNLNETNKMNHYLRCLNNAQLTLARDIKSNLCTLDVIKHELLIQTARLEKTYSAQLYEQKKLNRALQEHRALLAAIT